MFVDCASLSCVRKCWEIPTCRSCSFIFERTRSFSFFSKFGNSKSLLETFEGALRLNKQIRNFEGAPRLHKQGQTKLWPPSLPWVQQQKSLTVWRKQNRPYKMGLIVWMLTGLALSKPHTNLGMHGTLIHIMLFLFCFIPILRLPVSFPSSFVLFNLVTSFSSP